MLYDICLYFGDKNVVFHHLCKLLPEMSSQAFFVCRRFLRVDDYYFLAEFAMKSALLAVMNRVEDYENDSCSSDVRIAFLKEVLKVWQTAKKENLSAKNVTLANAMLAHAYLRLVGGVHKSHCPVSPSFVIFCRSSSYVLGINVPEHLIQCSDSGWRYSL